MLDLRELHRRMDREALILGNRLSLVLDTLEQLRRLTLLLFRHTPNDPQAIDAWLQRNGFATDSLGFFRSQAQLDRIAGGSVRPDELTFGWAGTLKDDPILRFRMYALRDLGADVQALRQRVEGAAWIYYQDARNACVVVPVRTSPQSFPLISTGTRITPT